MKLDKFTVGKRYGKALFELAMEGQQTEAIYQELLTLRKIYQNIPDLGPMLSDVRLDLHQKRSIMDNLLEGYQGIVKNFLEIVFQYNRMSDLSLIIDEYERRYDEEQGLIIAKVTTAVGLSEEQKQQIANKIAKTFGYHAAQLTEKIDPTILGGVIVEANHQVIDGSIKSRLEYLRQQLGR